MRRNDPFAGIDRTRKRQILAVLAQDIDGCDDDLEVDMLLVEPTDLDAEIDRKRIVPWSLARLTPREERIVRMRHGLGGIGTHTGEEIGAALGLTRSRCHAMERQVYRKTIRRLNRWQMGPPVAKPPQPIRRKAPHIVSVCRIPVQQPASMVSPSREHQLSLAAGPGHNEAEARLLTRNQSVVSQSTDLNDPLVAAAKTTRRKTTIGSVITRLWERLTRTDGPERASNPGHIPAVRER